jgi:cell division protein FtsB
MNNFRYFFPSGKYLIGIWTAVAVYCLFSFLSGPRGIHAYNQLLFEREQQRANMRELSILNEELEKTEKNLIYDYETILVHARQMGYGLEDERFVRIVGLSGIKNTIVTAGKVYFAESPTFLSDKIIKITALCAGFLAFIFVFILELTGFKSR